MISFKIWWLTGLRVLCSLKLSSRKADCSLESLSFFLVKPFSSSSLALELALSASIASKSLLRSLPLLIPKSIWKDDAALFGDEIAAPSSASSMDNRFTSNLLPGASVEPGSDTTAKIRNQAKNQQVIKKKNLTQILKTATELLKKYFSPKWRYSYLSAMESESWKEPDVHEEQERRAKDQVEVADLMIPFFHRLDSYFHGYLVCLVILLLQENHSLSPCKTQDLCLITLGFCQETWKALMYHLDSRPAPYFGTLKMSFQRFLKREKHPMYYCVSEMKTNTQNYRSPSPDRVPLYLFSLRV